MKKKSSICLLTSGRIFEVLYGEARFTLNLGYEIFKNKLVTFNLGKDFDKNFETGGNLIATLNLILGFGSMRPF